MAFRLTPHEPIPDGLRRIVREQFERSVALLEGPLEQRQYAVHETRKSFKRLRSLLRMLRQDMPTVFTVENARIRDMSGLLSPYRDADAMLETLDKLHQVAPDLLDDKMYAPAHQALAKSRDERLNSGDGYPPVAQQVVASLNQSLVDLEQWPMPQNLDHMTAVLRQTYKRARKAAGKARKSMHIEDFHSWRKRVKDLQFQTQVLQDTAAGLPRKFGVSLKTLAELLGNHHDLSILDELLDSPEIFPDREHAKEVQALVARHFEDLQQQAQNIGTDLFKLPAKRYREIAHDD